MKKLVLGTAVLMSSVVWAQTDTYQVASTLGFRDYVSNTNTNTKARGLIATSSFYFEPVALLSNMPYFEEASLLRNSSVRVGYYAGTYSSDTLATSDENNYSLGLTWHKNDFAALVDAGGWNSTPRSATVPGNYYTRHGETLSFGLGYYLDKKSAVFLRQAIDSYSSQPHGNLVAVADGNTSTTGLDFLSLIELAEGAGVVWRVGISQIRDVQYVSKDNQEIWGTVAYYFSRSLYLLGGYGQNQGNNASAEGALTTLGFGYAFAPRWAIQSKFNVFATKDSSRGNNFTDSSVYLTYRY